MFDRIYVNYINNDGKFSKQWELIEENKLNQWLNINKGMKSYFSSIQRYQESGKEAELHDVDFFMDLDADEEKGLTLEDSLNDCKLITDFFLTGFNIEPKIWYSGNRGFHITVSRKIFGAEPSDNLTYIWRYVMEAITNKLKLQTVDKRVYTRPRMWRIENTTHSSTGLYKIPLDISQLKTVEFIQGLAKKQRELEYTDNIEPVSALHDLYNQGLSSFSESLKRYDSIKDKQYDFSNVPNCIARLHEIGLEELGTKNKVDMVMACYYKDAGYSLEDAIQVMAEWAKNIPISLTHVENERARIAQTTSVIRSVYSDGKYGFTCPAMLSTGIKVDCDSCKVKEIKAIELQLVEYSKSENMGKLIAVEADVIGRDSKELLVPSVITGFCTGYDSDSAMCNRCSLANYFNLMAGKCERKMILDSRNSKTIELVDVSAINLQHRIKRLFNVDERCRSFKHEVEWANAQIIYAASKVSHDFNVQEKLNRVRMIYLGHGIVLNRSYKLTGRVYPHPRTQEAVMVVDTVEPLQSSLDTFFITNDKLHDLEIFKSVNGNTVLEQINFIHNQFVSNFLYIFGREDVLLAVDLTYHSARWIKFQRQVTKGWLDTLIFGDTRQGKSETVKKIMRYYNLGTIAMGEASGRTGLLYNVQMVAGEQAWIQFGLIPRSNGMLVCIDEIHGMNPHDFKEFTQVRSEGIVDVNRYASGSADAQTRLISLANPREGMSMGSYGYPVMALTDITTFSSLEDVSRFDIIVGVKAGVIDESIINKDVNTLKKTDTIYTPELCHDLVLWMWTRKPDQIRITGTAERKILQEAINIGRDYIPDIPLVESADVRYKILRIATACAGRLYNTKDNETLLVEEEHVDAAVQILNRFYKSPELDYWGYSEDMQRYILPEHEYPKALKQIQNQFIDWNSIIKWILRMNNFSKSNLSDGLMMQSTQVNALIGMLVNFNFITTNKWGKYVKTKNGREFLYKASRGEIVEKTEKEELQESLKEDDL